MATASTTWTERLQGSVTPAPDQQGDCLGDEAPTATNDNEPTGTILLKDGVLCFGPRTEIETLLSVHSYAQRWPRIPAEKLRVPSVQHPPTRR